MDLMVNVIAPASDLLWGFDEPQDADDWRQVDNATMQLMRAFESARSGGAGPSDSLWAKQASWQSYIDAEIDALEQAREAIANEDLDALFEAGNAIYTPCEGCHIDYNPGVQGQQ